MGCCLHKLTSSTVNPAPGPAPVRLPWDLNPPQASGLSFPSSEHCQGMSPPGAKAQPLRGQQGSLPATPKSPRRMAALMRPRGAPEDTFHRPTGAEAALLCRVRHPACPVAVRMAP